MWTLILVFIQFTGTGSGVSVATAEIPGFSSKQTCMDAGGSVLDEYSPYFSRRYSCVEVK